jgi:hypothetical protein
MGEAKRKKREFELWLASLPPNELRVAKVAQALFGNFVRPTNSVGMCYRMTAFLTERLAADGIAVEPVVGYVNDGTDNVMISHAWIEMAGKQTDITLGITEYPDVQLPGEVIILDRTMVNGQRYSYLREMTEAGRRYWEVMRDNPATRTMIEKKEAEHKAMSEIMQTSASRRSYLDAAPDGWNYERIAKAVNNQRLGRVPADF